MSRSLKKIVRILVLILFCGYCNLESMRTEKEKPEINFYGKLIDSSGHSYAVENITIGGRYKDIIVYQKPNTNARYPDTHKTQLNLAEISRIQTFFDPTDQTNGSTKKILTFDKRDYIQIEVTWHGRMSNQRYIIERYKKIFCDQVIDGLLLEKEISFEALKELRIDGYKERHSQHISYESMVTQTKAMLNSIEHEAHELSDKPEIKNIKDRILHLIDEFKIKIKNWFT